MEKIARGVEKSPCMKEFKDPKIPLVDEEACEK